MRVFLAALMVLLSIDAGQAADAVFPPGSAVGLSPPPGMSPAKSFAGFQDEARGASILMFTFPPVAYPDMASGFSDDGKLAQQGVTAGRRETLTLAGNPALLVSGRQQTAAGSFHKWIILVGSPKTVALVTAQYPDAAAAAYSDAAIRAALTSIVFREPPSQAEQTAALPFTTPPLGRFRIVSVLSGNSLLLTDGPADTDPDHRQASFIAVSVTAKPAPEERDAFARREFLAMRALQAGGIESAKAVTVEGLPAHEIVGSAQTRSGIALKIVQWILFGPTSTVMVAANARAPQFDQLYPEFVALRDGIRPK